MDEFDFKEVKAKKPGKLGAAIWNCGSLFFFLGAMAAAVFIILLFLNPFSELNPLPPIPATEIQSSTPTLEATQTPTATLEATATIEAAATTFQIQEGSPVRLDASVFHPELSCSFMGVAGQAFAQDGSPIADLQVHVTGTLDGQPVDKIGVTGAATQYGAGEYYEVQLANQPIASDNTLQVTLLNPSGDPVMDPFSFSTTASCQENLVLINFSEMP